MALHVVGVIVPLVLFHSARAAVRRHEVPSAPSRRAEGTLHRRTEPWWMASMSAQRSPLSSVRSSRVAMLEYSRGVWMCVGEGGVVAAKAQSSGCHLGSLWPAGAVSGGETRMTLTLLNLPTPNLLTPERQSSR